VDCRAGFAIAAETRTAVVRAEDLGMSSERLGRVKAAMQRYVDRSEVPGVVTSSHGTDASCISKASVIAMSKRRRR
jgi:hypothetical protein